jgi:hypothetical protein
MGNVGMALVVGGMALLCSGLIFLLPFQGRRELRQEPFEESQQRLHDYLQEMIKRGEDEA